MIALTLLWLNICTFIHPDETYAIKGKVTDPNKEPLEYFTAMLFFPADSTTTIGGTFVNGFFEFSSITSAPCSLKISCAGYKPVIIKLEPTDARVYDIGTIQMLPSRIDEITVQSRRPAFTQKAGRLHIQVAGTSLEEAGSLTDVLRMSPGLIIDGENNLTVMGKGTPIVYINDREVRDKSELETIRSNNVQTIEIDRSPSAEYNASGLAIVRIKTKALLKDQFNTELYSNLYFAKKFNKIAGGYAEGKYKNSSILAGGAITRQDGINKNENHIDNQLRSYRMENYSSTVLYPHVERESFFAYFDQQLAIRHNVGFQFYQKASRQDQLSETNQTTQQNGELPISRMLNKNKNEKNIFKTLNLNYSFKIDSLNSLSATGDFTRVDDRADEQTAINSTSAKPEEKETQSNNRNQYNIYSGKLDYTSNLLQKIQLKSGIKYSKVNNTGEILFKRDQLTDQSFSTNDRVHEYIAAAYFSVSQQEGTFNYEGGLRYEFTDTRVTSNATTIADSTYSHLFPAIKLSKDFCNKQSITISYTKKINRPRYRELSSELNYIDPLSYIMGNPTLKPTLTHYLNLSIGLFPNLEVSSEYRHENNPRIISTINDRQKPEIVKYLPVNIPNADYLSGTIHYSFTHKKFRSNISFELEKPFVEIPYRGNMRKIEKWSWGFQGNTDLKVLPNVSLFSQFHYFSSKEVLMTYYYHRYNLNLGTNISMLKRKITLMIMANDIFNSNENKWLSKYGNIAAKYSPDFDYSWIRVSLRYNFNRSAKGNIKDQSSNESELNRL